MNVSFAADRLAPVRVIGPRAKATPAASAAAPRWAGAPRTGEAVAPTRITLGAAAGGVVGYAAPRAPNVGPSRIREATHGDALDAALSSNSRPDAVMLAERWRGLGGVLLQQLSTTGQGIARTLAEVPPAQEEPDVIEGVAAPDPVVEAALVQARASRIATRAASRSRRYGSNRWMPGS